MKGSEAQTLSRLPGPIKETASKNSIFLKSWHGKQMENILFVCVYRMLLGTFHQAERTIATGS